MKKVIAILGCALLVVALAVTAFATQLDMTLSADKTVVKAGDVVTFTISMPELADCKSGGFNLDGLYDTEVFEFVGGDCPLDGTFLENVGYIGGKLSGSFAYMEATAVSGPIFTVQLKVKNTAPLGKTTVAPTVSVRNSAGNIETSINALELDVVAVAMTLTADKTTAVRGDIVTFEIATEEIAGCKSGGFNLDGLYDTEVFEFVGGDCPLNGTLLENVGYIGGKLSGSFMYSTGTTVSGPIFNIQLKVKDTAAFSKTTVAPIVSVRNSTGSLTAAVNSLELNIVCAHDWGTGTVTTAATCTTDGVQTYTCGICDETKTETIAMLGHAPETKVTREATCTTAGEKVTACATCGEHLSTEVIEKLGHAPETTVTKEPTYTADGEQVTTCTICQEILAVEKLDRLPGSLDGNEMVDEDDVIYLLQHLLMPGDFTVDQPVDYDNSDGVDEDDVIYLLQHILMPDEFPLK